MNGSKEFHNNKQLCIVTNRKSGQQPRLGRKCVAQFANFL